ncbi:D-alanyl-D-alanine carboxypeptidase family protein [Streptacidiphilus pinicola]|uniref:D-alanyl-D-alanine carboxypeptidase family protein n=1 Tax=Streptacidiphilus pinicola TaxID=2219663 RepID=UPI001AA00666|nr:LPXTG cell wall anchor domain-containing protein [Streptacidiphilus pinicola]
MQLHDRVRTSRTVRGTVAAATAAGVVLTLTAAGHAPSSSTSPVRQPPAQMSAVGGDALGRPGPQTGAGAPALPRGLSALSWIVSDADTGQVLGAENPHWQLPPASTLKTLFADTVLPKIPQTATHKVVESDFDGMGEGSSEVGVMPGQTYLVSDLWLGVFLRSGNDAVHVLAAMNGGVAATVQQMQARAQALGANDTHVVSPDGYDMPGQVSSAYDLTLFARDGLKNPDFAKYCNTAIAKFPGGPSTKGKPFEIDNTNRLLTGFDGVGHYPGLIGVKNGYTTNAGNTLIEAAQRNGHTLLVTVMNPQNHAYEEVYHEARELLDWGFSADGHATPIGTLDAVKSPSGDAANPSAHASAGTAAGPWSATASSNGGSSTTTYLAGAAGALALGTGGVLFLRRRRRRSR